MLSFFLSFFFLGSFLFSLSTHLFTFPIHGFNGTRDASTYQNHQQSSSAIIRRFPSQPHSMCVCAILLLCLCRCKQPNKTILHLLPASTRSCDRSPVKRTSRAPMLLTRLTVSSVSNAVRRLFCASVLSFPLSVSVCVVCTYSTSFCLTLTTLAFAHLNPTLSLSLALSVISMHCVDCCRRFNCAVMYCQLFSANGSNIFKHIIFFFASLLSSTVKPRVQLI